MTVVRNAEKEAGDGSGTRLIAAYSAAVIGLEIILTIIMARVGPASSWATPLMLGIMWTPGLVALALQLAVRRTVRGFGWAPGPARFYAIAYLLPLAYGGLALVAAQLLGAGTIDFQRWATGAGRWGLPEHALYGMLIQMTLFMIPGLVTGIGEEIGWRGFLVPKLSERLGFWGIVNVSYVIWLAFHLPGVFGGGYHGNGTPLPYALLCFAALLYPGTVFLTALRLQSGSLWPCAFYHAAHNCFIQVMWNSAFKPNALAPWLLGEFGALLPILFAVILAGLWKTGIVRFELAAAAPRQPQIHPVAGEEAALPA